MDIVVVPFDKDHVEDIACWPQNEIEARSWAGQSVSFPVLPEQICCWHCDASVFPMVGEVNDELVAYGELWIDEDEGEIELARIIVKPNFRNQGVGKKIVAALVERAATFGLDDVFIRVMPDNVRAIRCYLASGFERISESDEAFFNDGQPCQYVWLKYMAS